MRLITLAAISSNRSRPSAAARSAFAFSWAKSVSDKLTISSSIAAMRSRDLLQLAQYANQVRAYARTLYRVGAAVETGQNASQRVFIACRIGGVDFLHQALTPGSVYLIGCGIRVNPFGSFAVELFQFG